MPDALGPGPEIALLERDERRPDDRMELRPRLFLHLLGAGFALFYPLTGAAVSAAGGEKGGAVPEVIDDHADS